MTALRPWVDPALARPGTYQQLSCGCEVWIQDADDGGAAVIRPCHPACPVYGYALEKIAEQGASVEYRHDT